MKSEKKIYFASDVHLGAPTIKNPKEHEKIFVSWLDDIKDSAAEIYLLGDIFDFWFEYKRVVPRGFTRLFGKLAEITDLGIPVYFFTGNHDIWIFDYLPNETGVKIYRNPVEKVIDGKRFFLAHGDGLGNYDRKFNFIKKIFTNKIAQWLFAHIHPNFGIGFATVWSKHSREKNMVSHGSVYLGDDNEWLVLFAKEKLKESHFDYFVFGHRHIVLSKEIAPNSSIIYLGDWISNFTYGVWDGKQMQLMRYTKFDKEINNK
ncbi:MAG: UDP-2,3-diacylglucosamine diphosphatase [Marinilabiliaceae bacterium]|nr:UDP-2,3-diacylglucosamine diphosphatase [Marinilabiliaceae bacterium]